MAESRVITAYLAELRRATAHLADGDDILAEAEDHLVSSVEAGMARGLDREAAEAEALARYGDSTRVGRSFVEEAKRGGAVSTAFTRAAGAAAMIAVPAGAAIAFGASVAPTGLRDALLVVLGAAFAVFGIALWGVRVRHSGLGWWGRTAAALFVASPFLAFAAPWRALPVLAVLLSVVMMLAGVGMLRAAILPRPALWLFTVAPPVTTLLAAAWAIAADTGTHYDLEWLATSQGAPEVRAVLLMGLTAFAVATMWIGWAMWNEPALDARETRRRRVRLR